MNAKACAYAAKKTFGIQKKYIIDLGLWTKCDHCKKYHKLYLNYNSENNSSSWVDMMEFFLKWNKQQNLDEINQETTHNIEFKKKQIHLAATIHYFWYVIRGKWVSTRNQTFLKIEKSRSQTASDNH